MTQIPEGWYPDPAAPPGLPAGQRWWDGAQWTGHVAAAQAYGGGLPGQPATTPDGVPLASWGARLGAYLIDSLLVGVVAGVVGFPFLLALGRGYGHFVDQLDAAARTGQQPDIFGFYADNLGPLLGYILVQTAVKWIYDVLFLKSLAATPGKLALGMRVRLRDQPGPLTWGTVGRRWLVQDAYLLAALLPGVGLFGWVDGLWPLGNPQRQALHDKFARTNVVKTR